MNSPPGLCEFTRPCKPDEEGSGRGMGPARGDGTTTSEWHHVHRRGRCSSPSTSATARLAYRVEQPRASVWYTARAGERRARCDATQCLGRTDVKCGGMHDAGGGGVVWSVGTDRAEAAVSRLWRAALSRFESLTTAAISGITGRALQRINPQIHPPKTHRRRYRCRSRSPHPSSMLSGTS